VDKAKMENEIGSSFIRNGRAVSTRKGNSIVEIKRVRTNISEKKKWDEERTAICVSAQKYCIKNEKV
jgi:hypothetical protein